MRTLPCTHLPLHPTFRAAAFCRALAAAARNVSMLGHGAARSCLQSDLLALACCPCPPVFQRAVDPVLCLPACLPAVNPLFLCLPPLPCPAGLHPVHCGRLLLDPAGAASRAIQVSKAAVSARRPPLGAAGRTWIGEASLCMPFPKHAACFFQEAVLGLRQAFGRRLAANHAMLSGPARPPCRRQPVGQALAALCKLPRCSI